MNSKIRKICVLAIGLLIGHAAFCQPSEYHLQLFSYPSGIRPDEVVSMTKDKKGFLWILYRSRVQSFDGKEVQDFRPAPRVKSLLCDKQGRIWVTADEEVFLFSEKAGTFRSVPLNPGAENLKIGPTAELPDGRIWLVTEKGFYQFDSNNTQFLELDAGIQIKSGLLTDESVVYGHYLFVNNSRYIYRYNIWNGVTDSMSVSGLYDFYPVNEDSLLVSVDFSSPLWFQFSNGAKSVATLSDRNIQFSIKDVAQISPTRFLVSTSEGISEYDAIRKEFLGRNFFLNGRKVATKEFASSIFFDKSEGYVWLATTDGILRFVLKNQPMALIKLSQMNEEISADVNDVRRIVQDERGRLWIATGYGFACWEKHKNKWTIFPPAKNDSTRLSHESVRGLVYDGRYLILGPTNKGLWLYDINTGQYRRPVYTSEEVKNLSERDFVNDITTLQNGDHIVVANRAIYLLDGKTYQLRQLHYPELRKEAAIFCLQGKDGTVWIATSTELYCFDASLNYLTKIPLHFRSNTIIRGFSGFVMKDNGLLIAGFGGLYAIYYRNGEVETRKVTDVFDNFGIYIIYQDNNGVIWTASENGIYRFDPRTSKLNLFDRSDNVQGYGFNGNGWFRDKDNILYFVGINGINYWQPETFSAPYESFEAYISRVRMADKDYSRYTLDSIRPLPYSDRSLEVTFSSVYFNNPEKVQYRYKLIGRDTEWKEIDGGNKVSFSALLPGDYELEMQASLNQVDWKNASNGLKFRVLSPFWLSWWFIMLGMLLSVVIIAGLLINHKWRLKLHKEELETAQAINYFASDIYQSLDEAEMLRTIVRNCVNRLHFNNCVIIKKDDNTEGIEEAAFFLSGDDMLELYPDFDGYQLALNAIRNGRSEMRSVGFGRIHGYRQDDWLLSEIAVPVVVDDYVWGAIYGSHSKRDFFKPKHLSVLAAIASLCANKIIKNRADRERLVAELTIKETRQKLEEAKMQALRAQMNPHFIFNCLNSINRYIVKSDPVTASLYLTRFARLIRLILDNSNSKAITLARELEALKLYMEMEGLRFEKKIACDIRFSNDVYPESVCVPPLIMQPYVENAIWHGLLHKESGGHLTISISWGEEGVLQCVIEDNGVGRKKADELKNQSTLNKTSLGMKLTENRLRLMSKPSHSHSLVEIEDLEDDRGEALGTKVTLHIPVNEP